jgi:hypothetical protein
MMQAWPKLLVIQDGTVGTPYEALETSLSFMNDDRTSFECVARRGAVLDRDLTQVANEIVRKQEVRMRA